MTNQIATHTKSSFDPISSTDTEILILGTLPGDKSLELGEYYGHARNRFWKILATLTENDFPLSYDEKKALLLKSKIGVWDVVHKANRKGSLDVDIQQEVANDLENFIASHTNLKVIAFNGQKAEKLFDKYFKRISDFTYICLPSSSPANAGINFENICTKWQVIFESK